MKSIATYHLTLTSERENIRQVEPFLRSVHRIDEMGEKRFHDLLVSLTEAVNNAIIHGNKCDPEKPVMIDIESTPKQITCVIHDHGGGFDPADIPDPRLPENLLNEGGRGVFLIRHLSDSVEFSATNNGMAVVITYLL